MSISPDTTAHIFANEYAERIENGGLRAAEVDAPEMIARAIRADRQQFGPLVQKVRRAVANDEYIALMVAAVKLAGAIEDGMVEK